MDTDDFDIKVCSCDCRGILHALSQLSQLGVACYCSVSATVNSTRQNTLQMRILRSRGHSGETGNLGGERMSNWQATCPKLILR